LELLADIVRRNDGDAFYVKEMIYEETGDAELV
jgi:hypothetical protein